MFIAEFLYRGRHESEGQAPAYHARLGDLVSQFGESKIVYSEPMTPEQLEAAGFPLSAIVAEVNSAALQDLDRTRANLKETQAALDASQAAYESTSKALGVVEEGLRVATERLGELEEKARASALEQMVKNQPSEVASEVS